MIIWLTPLPPQLSSLLMDEPIVKTQYGIVGCFGNLSNIINFSFFEVKKTFLKSNFCIPHVPNCA